LKRNPKLLDFNIKTKQFHNAYLADRWRRAT